MGENARGLVRLHSSWLTQLVRKVVAGLTGKVDQHLSSFQTTEPASDATICTVGKCWRSSFLRPPPGNSADIHVQVFRRPSCRQFCSDDALGHLAVVLHLEHVRRVIMVYSEFV